MQWHQLNITRGEPTWKSNDGRFAIVWAGRLPTPIGCYRLYDRKDKQHIYGFVNVDQAKDLAKAMSVGTVHKVGLVACSSQKRDAKSMAFMLYTSDLFRKARDYCQRRYDQWFILSAKHGLVKPNTWLKPYDHKLTAADGSAWAEMALGQIKQQFAGRSNVLYYAHAGLLYTSPLLSSIPMIFPMKGLGIGQQLSYYKKASHVKAPNAPADT